MPKQYAKPEYYSETGAFSWVVKPDGTKLVLIHSYDVGETNEIIAKGALELHEADEILFATFPYSGFDGAMEPFIDSGKPVYVAVPTGKSGVRHISGLDWNDWVIRVLVPYWQERAYERKWIVKEGEHGTTEQRAVYKQ